MKGISTFILLLMVSIGYAQTLPINFETGVTTANFVNFDGGTGTVIPNPQSNGINTSATVAQIVRNGGAIWAGSKMTLATNPNFSTGNVISMKVFSTAPVGTVVKFKLEGNGDTERDALTTVSNAWETLTWDFTGEPANFSDLVFMFDFGNVGNGSATSTFLFDDIEQISGGSQIDLPVTFEGTTINYATTDFGGTASSIVADPTNASNTVVKVIKTDQAATWAGTTIGTPAGFATDIPLTLTSSKMNVKVWSPTANTPVRLKVEDSGDATRTCETQTNTTVAGAWEVLEFDFTMEAAGTATLSAGLANGWTYNMASIFFNFGTDGQTAGEQTYYFDEVRFGEAVGTAVRFELEGVSVFPNPAVNEWVIKSENAVITTVEIFDLQGKRLVAIHPNNYNVTIDAADFAAGIYVSKISTAAGTGSLKLVKN
jgi:hypothetical protein